MGEVERYCEKAIEKGMDDARVIDPASIVTAEWVRMKCQFGCPGYGRSHCCPPHTPTPETTRKVIDSYRTAILLHRRIPDGRRRREETRHFNTGVVQLEIDIFLDGYYKAFSMTSGPCRLCKECDLQQPCKHGMEARPSMEACGIDVFETARRNGLEIRVVRSPEERQDIFGLILVE
ncbi:MAG: DUF2284 domain-containing protein [Desulfobacterota bacterium]|nr:DUF2284 domain-containing protein [Thermodesulfobacteriota bacterium]